MTTRKSFAMLIFLIVMSLVLAACPPEGGTGGGNLQPVQDTSSSEGCLHVGDRYAYDGDVYVITSISQAEIRGKDANGREYVILVPAALSPGEACLKQPPSASCGICLCAYLCHLPTNITAGLFSIRFCFYVCSTYCWFVSGFVCITIFLLIDIFILSARSPSTAIPDDAQSAIIHHSPVSVPTDIPCIRNSM